MVAPIRSLLFSPASKPSMVEKALNSEADGVIIDLEDAVAASEKDTTRKSLPDLEGSSMVTLVRVNGADTEWFWRDIVAAARTGADAVVIPKAESADVIRKVDGALTAIEAEHGRATTTEIIPLIESARGVFDVHDILAASDRVTTLLYGSAEQGDLVADLGCEWSPEGRELLTSRSWVLLAARAAAIEQPLDAVFMNIKDLDGLRRECELARSLGYTGKAAIHPAQIPVINDAFTPSPDEVEHQRHVLQLFSEALERGDGALAVDGVMVDYASARRAEAILARAEAAERSTGRSRSPQQSG